MSEYSSRHVRIDPDTGLIDLSGLYHPADRAAAARHNVKVAGRLVKDSLARLQQHLRAAGVWDNDPATAPRPATPPPAPAPVTGDADDGSQTVWVWEFCNPDNHEDVRTICGYMDLGQLYKEARQVFGGYRLERTSIRGIGGDALLPVNAGYRFTGHWIYALPTKPWPDPHTP